MAFASKTDYSGIARTGLEVVANGDGASNQVLEIPGADGSFIANEIFGHIKSPKVEFKITGDLTLANLSLGKVHGTTGSAAASGPFALKHFHAHSGAGEEPTADVDLVQIEAGANQTVCIYDIPSLALSPARHALTYGAFTYDEDADLTLQSSDFDADCEIDPTTINGVPKASDAVKAKLTVQATMWSTSDEEAPDVTVASGWSQTADWACTGSDGALFVWTATFTKYLAKHVPST